MVNTKYYICADSMYLQNWKQLKRMTVQMLSCARSNKDRLAGRRGALLTGAGQALHSGGLATLLLMVVGEEPRVIPPPPWMPGTRH